LVCDFCNSIKGTLPTLEASGIGQIGQHGYTDLIDSLQNVYRFPQKKPEKSIPAFFTLADGIVTTSSFGKS
jgi:hypothetical protein